MPWVEFLFIVFCYLTNTFQLYIMYMYSDIQYDTKRGVELRISISSQSSAPIYEQIKEQIIASIISGELSENELLPSIRRLACDLKVSVITTTRAYNDLEIEGFVKTIPGKGCYVQKVDNELVIGKHKRESEAALARAVREGKLAGLSMTDLHKLLDDVEVNENGKCY